jgi:hypothetical protein
VSDAPAERTYWRVGYHGDPLGFLPLEICEWSHRFDDPRSTTRIPRLYLRLAPCFRCPSATSVMTYLWVGAPRGAMRKEMQND